MLAAQHNLCKSLKKKSKSWYFPQLQGTKQGVVTVWSSNLLIILVSHPQLIDKKKAHYTCLSSAVEMEQAPEPRRQSQPHDYLRTSPPSPGISFLCFKDKPSPSFWQIPGQAPHQSQQTSKAGLGFTLALSDLSPFRTPSFRSKRSPCTADRADQGGNSRFVPAIPCSRDQTLHGVTPGPT